MNSDAGNIWSSLMEKRTVLRVTVYFIFLPKISAPWNPEYLFSILHLYPLTIHGDHQASSWCASSIQLFSKIFPDYTILWNEQFKKSQNTVSFLLFHIENTKKNSCDWPEIHRQSCRSGWEMHVKSKMSESCLARWCWENHLDFIN